MSSFSIADLQDLADEIHDKYLEAREKAERLNQQWGIVQARIEVLTEQANDPSNYDDDQEGCDRD